MQHGGDLTEAMARHGGDTADWLDLSTGINPHAYPVPAISPAHHARLPARADIDGLLAAARCAYDVSSGAGIVAAPGTSALIALAPRLVPAGPVAIFGPTYGEHAAAWRAAGAEVIDARPGDALPAEARHAVLVHPNNPDGRQAKAREVLGLAEAVAARGGVLVLDESFVDLVPGRSHAALVATHPIIVLRSFGKFYGLAGLRLGFAVASPALACPIETALGPWAVSGPAIAVGTAALSDSAWAEAIRERLAMEAGALDRVLARAGLDIAGGTELFRLVRHQEAGALHERLAARRIWVRRFDWAPDLLRFGLPGSTAGLDRLAEALRAVHG